MIRREKNEIVIFLINLFFGEFFGKYIVKVCLWFFRLLGWGFISDAYYASPHHSYYTFFIILCIVTMVSVVRIVRSSQQK